LANIDDLTTVWINAAAGQNPVWDAVMVAATNLGVPLMVVLVAAQWWWSGGKEDQRHLRHVIVAAGLSSLGGFAFNQLVLLVVHRVRPYDAGTTHLIVPPSSEWSFPSDHATVAVAIAAAFALHAERPRAVVFGLMAFVVAWSRVYVGTHYLGDVVGGAFTAAIAAGLVRWLYREGTELDRRLTGFL
jgi:undecaprenyl-diphosphatase